MKTGEKRRDGRSCLVPELSISSENSGKAPSLSSPIPSPPCTAECPCVEWCGAHRGLGAPVAGAAALPLGTAGASRHAPLSLRNPARSQRTLWPLPPPRAGVKEHPSPLVTETKTWGPSRQVKVQEAGPPLLPEGGGDPPRAPGRGAARPLRAPSLSTLR